MNDDRQHPWPRASPVDTDNIRDSDNDNVNNRLDNSRSEIHAPESSDSEIDETANNDVDGGSSEDDKQEPENPKNPKKDGFKQESDRQLIELFDSLIMGDLGNAKSILIVGKRGYGKTYDTNSLANIFMLCGWKVHAVTSVDGHISGQPHNYITAGETPLESAFVAALQDVTGYDSSGNQVKKPQRACVVIDEVDMYCSNRKMSPALQKLINYGRHYGIWIVYNARRAANIHKDLSALPDCVIAHYLSDDTDLNYLQGVTSPEFRNRVEAMSNDIAVIVRKNGDDIRKHRREIFIG